MDEFSRSVALVIPILLDPNFSDLFFLFSFFLFSLITEEEPFEIFKNGRIVPRVLFPSLLRYAWPYVIYSLEDWSTRSHPRG